MGFNEVSEPGSMEHFNQSFRRYICVNGKSERISCQVGASRAYIGGVMPSTCCNSSTVSHGAFLGPHAKAFHRDDPRPRGEDDEKWRLGMYLTALPGLPWHSSYRWADSRRCAL